MKPALGQTMKAHPKIAQPSVAKKVAIANTLKMSTSASSLTTAAKKLPVTKTMSGPSTSRLASKATAPVPPKPAAKLNMKPAPYDFKARHALATEKLKEYKEKIDQQKEQMASLEEIAEQAEKKENELTEKLEAVTQKLTQQIEANEVMVREIEELKAANGNLTTKNHALATTLAATSEELSELKVKQEKLEETARDHEKLKQRTETMELTIAETSNKLQLSQDQLYQINVERMVLHNMVLDLRGNIRVFARVRPPLEPEVDKMLCGWSFVDEASLEIHSNELVAAGGRKQTKHDFAFDHVFDPNTSQDEIFETVSPLIQSALDGYNVCIFAYGKSV